jgi:hypothetical protein
MLEIAVAVTGVAFAVIAAVHDPVSGGIVLFVVDFFLLAGLPVVLDWSRSASSAAAPVRTCGARFSPTFSAAPSNRSLTR